MRWMTLGLLMGAGVANAAPRTLTHQGRVLDAAGDPVNGAHELELAIVDASQAVLAVESFSITLDNGYYQVVVKARAKSPAFSSGKVPTRCGALRCPIRGRVCGLDPDLRKM